jgi:hypothetical protein
MAALYRGIAKSGEPGSVLQLRSDRALVTVLSILATTISILVFFDLTLDIIRLLSAMEKTSMI